MQSATLTLETLHMLSPDLQEDFKQQLEAAMPRTLYANVYLTRNGGVTGTVHETKRAADAQKFPETRLGKRCFPVVITESEDRKDANRNGKQRALR